MSDKIPPAGIFPPVTTPFDPTTGDIAPVQFRQNLERLCAEGVDGVVVSGSTGEAPLLDAEEQRQLVGLARETLTDGTWIIAGTGAESTRQTIALSKAAGADYVKTSTGFGPGGATVADVALMRRVVGPDIGVKAAGGVRDYEALKNLVTAGASRVGASAGVKIVQESKGGAKSSPSVQSGY